MLLLVLAVSSPVRADNRFEITPYVAFQAGGGFGNAEGDIDFSKGEAYGVFVDVTVNDEMQIEFMYNRQPTTVSARDRLSEESQVLFDMNIEHFQGGVLFQGPDAPMRLFGVFSMGATRWDPKDTDAGTEWLFSLGLAGGFKSMFAEHMGARFQAGLIFPYLNPTTGLFCNLPDGCITGVPGTMTVQANLSAGLILAF
jgi:hypothetical protein